MLTCVVYACVPVHMFLCVCLDTRRQYPGVFLNRSSSSYIFRQGFSLKLGSPTELDWLTIELQGSCISASPMLRLQARLVYPDLHIGCRDSWSGDQCFISQAVCPGSQVVTFRSESFAVCPWESHSQALPLFILTEVRGFVRQTSITHVISFLIPHLKPHKWEH